MADDEANFELFSRTPRVAERRSFGAREISVIIILLLNFASIVWGASKMSSAIDSLKSAVGVINVKHDDFDARIRLMESEVAVVKARIFILEQETVK